MNIFSGFFNLAYNNITGSIPSQIGATTWKTEEFLGQSMTDDPGTNNAFFLNRNQLCTSDEDDWDGWSIYTNGQYKQVYEGLNFRNWYDGNRCVVPCIQNQQIWMGPPSKIR
mmetsp:Transcript_29281/g.78622  ORF Transcript_29281/g.78622 Transcript_29281/m.78622 type:complete len:112 (-) Transcript_29281:100-435(-)